MGELPPCPPTCGALCYNHRCFALAQSTDGLDNLKLLTGLGEGLVNIFLDALDSFIEGHFADNGLG